MCVIESENAVLTVGVQSGPVPGSFSIPTADLDGSEVEIIKTFAVETLCYVYNIIVNNNNKTVPRRFSDVVDGRTRGRGRMFDREVPKHRGRNGIMRRR